MSSHPRIYYVREMFAKLGQLHVWNALCKQLGQHAMHEWLCYVAVIPGSHLHRVMHRWGRLHTYHRREEAKQYLYKEFNPCI